MNFWSRTARSPARLWTFHGFVISEKLYDLIQILEATKFEELKTDANLKPAELFVAYNSGDWAE